jgi:hypothetical protein
MLSIVRTFIRKKLPCIIQTKHLRYKRYCLQTQAFQHTAIYLNFMPMRQTAFKCESGFATFFIEDNFSK